METELPTVITEPAIEESTAATELPEETVPAEPIHSEFYIPDVSVDDVILYFNEVCLDAEITHEGNPKVLQKWVVPIRYTIYGSPTEADVEVLSGFTQWLNTVEGFPGIRSAEEGETANLQIHFCDQPEMIRLMGEGFYDMDGAVTFWYDFDEIYDAIICYRTDVHQNTRNSVILEEIYNGLGPIQDTVLRIDSIIYAEYSEPQSLTEMDKLLLKLLYHPQLVCGMDAERCAAVIRQLYY